MSFPIQFIPEAAADFRALDGALKKQVATQMAKLQNNPFAGEALGIKNNVDLTGFYKIYFAKKTYRIVYRVVRNKIEIVEIWGIGRRDKLAIYQTIARRRTKPR